MNLYIYEERFFYVIYKIIDFFCSFVQGVPEKYAQCLRTTILQLYVTESGFQQAVRKGH